MRVAVQIRSQTDTFEVLIKADAGKNSDSIGVRYHPGWAAGTFHLSPLLPLSLKCTAPQPDFQHTGFM